MIALKCPRCSHELALSESERGQEVRCPRCGAIMPSESIGGRAETVPAKAVTKKPAGTDSSSVPTPTPASSHDNDTLAPPISGQPETFPYLSPTENPNELGSLAHYRVLRL